MATDLRGRHLLSMKDLSGEEIVAVLDLADDLKANRDKWFRAAPLAGLTLGMLFQKPSLRTRVSFETGMTRLGGHAIYLSPIDFKIGERETTEDIAIVLSRYVDVIMARVFGHNIVEDLARHATCPVINGLSDFEHPCQILADLQTIRQRKGTLRGLTLNFIGDGVLGIVSGAWWYEGPDFQKRHPIGEVPAFGEYFDDFSTIPLDVNADGRLDFITGGWFGRQLQWRENPGDPEREAEAVRSQEGIPVLKSVTTSWRSCRTRPRGRWWSTSGGAPACSRRM